MKILAIFPFRLILDAGSLAKTVFILMERPSRLLAREQKPHASCIICLDCPFILTNYQSIWKVNFFSSHHIFSFIPSYNTVPKSPDPYALLPFLTLIFPFLKIGSKKMLTKFVSKSFDDNVIPPAVDYKSPPRRAPAVQLCCSATSTFPPASLPSKCPNTRSTTSRLAEQPKLSARSWPWPSSRSRMSASSGTLGRNTRRRCLLDRCPSWRRTARNWDNLSPRLDIWPGNMVSTGVLILLGLLLSNYGGERERVFLGNWLSNCGKVVLELNWLEKLEEFLNLLWELQNQTFGYDNDFILVFERFFMFSVSIRLKMDNLKQCISLFTLKTTNFRSGR